MNLFEIDREIEKCVDVETGEIIDFEALEKLQVTRDEKIENIGLWIKNLESNADQIDIEIKRLQERKKAAASKAESLKKYLSATLDGKKFETARLSIKWRKSEGVIVPKSYKDVPEKFRKYGDPTIDKAGIKKALKSGIEIPGCHLETRNNIQIG